MLLRLACPLDLNKVYDTIPYHTVPRIDPLKTAINNKLNTSNFHFQGVLATFVLPPSKIMTFY